eukprot:Colp12_sorted_trinity150504_noHs@10573
MVRKKMLPTYGQWPMAGKMAKTFHGKRNITFSVICVVACLVFISNNVSDIVNTKDKNFNDVVLFAPFEVSDSAPTVAYTTFDSVDKENTVFRIHTRRADGTVIPFGGCLFHVTVEGNRFYRPHVSDEKNGSYVFVIDVPPGEWRVRVHMYSTYNPDCRKWKSDLTASIFNEWECRYPTIDKELPDSPKIFHTSGKYKDNSRKECRPGQQFGDRGFFADLANKCEPPYCTGEQQTNPWMWVPHNCYMHMFSSTEMASCLSERFILFIGDSTLRQLYFSLTNQFSNPPKSDSKVLEDETIIPQHNIRIKFISISHPVRVGMELLLNDETRMGQLKSEAAKASLVITGSMLHDIAAPYPVEKDGDLVFTPKTSELGRYKTNISLLAKYLSSLGKPVIWRLSQGFTPTSYRPRLHTFRPDVVKRAHELASIALSGVPHVYVWRDPYTMSLALNEAWAPKPGETLHWFGTFVAQQEVQLLLNFICDKVAGKPSLYF